MSEEDYLCVKTEEEDEAVIMDQGDNGLSTQSFMPVQQNSEASSAVHQMNQLAYGSEGLPVLADQTASQMRRSGMIQRGNGHSPENMDFVFLHNKRKRLSPAVVEHNVMRTREEEYEDSDSVIYEYEQDYECESILSEASYTGYQQNPLTEVLSYCQAMYDAIQKLDKKFDLLHRKVSEMQHARIKPILLKPKPFGFTYRSSSHLPSGKRVQKHMERDLSLHLPSSGQGRHSPVLRVALQNGHVQVNSKVKHAPQSFHLESQQPFGRQSPPLPTIVSTHSLHSSYTATNGMPDLSPQSNLAPNIVESTVNVASSPVASPSIPAPSEPSQENNAVELNYRNASEDVNISEELPSSSVFISPSFEEFVGDPARNVKVLGHHLVKARQKAKPKFAARHLVRVLFPKKTLLCSVMGASARGRRTLDPNKIAAIREFLETNFPTYDLSEHGKDWKTCITNVNSMIRCLRSETKRNSANSPKETTEGKEKVSVAPDTSHCVDLNYNEDSEDNSQSSQKMTSSTTDTLQNSGPDKIPEAFHTSSIRKQQSLEPMEPLGSPWRNIQLPFSVIYVAKGKTRPELSARYLIRHMFPEDVLVKSNVYGSLDRGMSPLDSNKINALREFLKENFPSFDLNESGFDWKACVGAINSTIRSLRHELKKATSGIRQRASALPPSSAESPRGSQFRKARAKQHSHLSD
ncbi:hypothetical protein HGM15179_000596 [Zosterops borbonicus]|uniref:BEN domain-containing protein n=1 Tax=Zosterops borbonicus TaxID=364589 RepID=A0A8K1GZD4_9PASS|nr:hypothetical protein HGM15179_000596 [Zosterops borbonicus]